jgi:hypothetical protein
VLQSRCNKFFLPKGKKHIVTRDVVGLLREEVVSTKKTHRCKGCGWLASRRGSKYKKKHIVQKDVVSLQVGDSKNNSLTGMKTY